MADIPAHHKLSSQIKRLTKAIEKQNSFYHNFLVGVVRGLGTALGASFVAAIVIMLLSIAWRWIERMPIIENLLPVDRVSNILETS